MTDIPLSARRARGLLAVLVAALLIGLIPQPAAAQESAVESAIPPVVEALRAEPLAPVEIELPDPPPLPERAAGEPLHLSLEQALVRAVTYGEEIRISTSQEAELAAEIRAARSAAFPQVAAQASYARQIRSPFGDLSGDGDDAEALPFGQDNTYDARITLDQALYSGGRIGAGLEIAKQAAAAARDQTDETLRDLALAVTIAYYDAVLARRLVEITGASRDLIDEQLGQVRLLRQAGNASDLDVLRVEVERESLEPDLVQARNAEAVALLDLKRLVDLPADLPLDLTSGLEPDGFRVVSDERLADVAHDALERRSAVDAAERDVRIRELQVRLANAEFLPAVSLQAAFAKQAFPRDSIPDFGDFRDDWSVSVGVRVPLFTGGRRLADVRSAEERAEQSRYRLVQLRESVALEIDRLIGEIRRTTVLLEARRNNTRRAERVYELTRLSYDQGVAINLELQDARLDLQSARASEAQALHDYFLAMARLLREAAAPLELSSLDLVRTASSQPTPATDLSSIVHNSPRSH